MAALSESEKAKIRNFIEEKATSASVPISWVKGAINAAAQAIQDLEDGTKTIVKADVPASLLAIGSADIDAATSPFGITFTGQQKKWLRAKVLELRFLKDKV